VKTDISDREVETIVEQDERVLLHRLLVAVEPHVDLPPLRHGRLLPGPRVWARLVSQVCVMGSSRGMERLQRNGELPAFRRAASLPELKKHRRNHLAKVLAEYSATRFPNQAAKKLRQVIDLPTAVEGDRCVLLAGLGRLEGADTIRDTLMGRCPIFKLKSARER